MALAIRHAESPSGSRVCIASTETPRLTAANAPELKADVTAMVGQGYKHYVVDLSGLAFLDSSGLGALVGLLQSVEAGSHVCICGLTGVVRQLFEITHMTKVFKIHDNVDDAVNWLQELA